MYFLDKLRKFEFIMWTMLCPLDLLLISFEYSITLAGEVSLLIYHVSLVNKVNKDQLKWTSCIGQQTRSSGQLFKVAGNSLSVSNTLNNKDCFLISSIKYTFS